MNYSKLTNTICPVQQSHSYLYELTRIYEYLRKNTRIFVIYSYFLWFRAHSTRCELFEPVKSYLINLWLQIHGKVLQSWNNQKTCWILNCIGVLWTLNCIGVLKKEWILNCIGVLIAECSNCWNYSMSCINITQSLWKVGMWNNRQKICFSFNCDCDSIVIHFMMMCYIKLPCHNIQFSKSGMWEYGDWLTLQCDQFPQNKLLIYALMS